ncbi:extracellular solute-binding protein [Martelella alba]|uniref:Extracellular solute-binding protein n=1 Tax=Martelella alba TaxID=2590451 RepID=A0A506U396_9HYPH|nr:extracellular solute-binding protein [Martelella alba]TPW27485.1 extracellular solute-binding protein [Martelella alba]
MMTVLKGMTWSHPRGYDPMVATARQWAQKTGVLIRWDKRSLQDFESFPVEELARQYDLIVIDHPHVGQVTAEGCLQPLDVAGRETERQALALGSVGTSYDSYHFNGRQWAFPIDAAAQVMALGPELSGDAPADFDAVLSLARDGRVLLPLRPPHSLMTFFTLAANTGFACRNDGPGLFVDPAGGEAAFERLTELASLVPGDNFNHDPIAVLEEMARAESPYIVSPYIYGYVSYAMPGFRARQIAFADMPGIDRNGPRGSALGGTGIAVSAFSNNPEAALDYAYWVASGDVQKAGFAKAGGQPGHADAWEDDAVNAAAGQFYRRTRRTLKEAYLRPRHDGYMDFQARASAIINDGLTEKRAASAVIASLNAAYEESFNGTAALS